jgi:hypothetical protein
MEFALVYKEFVKNRGLAGVFHRFMGPLARFWWTDIFPALTIREGQSVLS